MYMLYHLCGSLLSNSGPCARWHDGFHLDIRPTSFIFTALFMSSLFYPDQSSNFRGNGQPVQIVQRYHFVCDSVGRHSSLLGVYFLSQNGLLGTKPLSTVHLHTNNTQSYLLCAHNIDTWEMFQFHMLLVLFGIGGNCLWQHQLLQSKLWPMSTIFFSLFCIFGFIGPLHFVDLLQLFRKQK